MKSTGPFQLSRRDYLLATLGIIAQPSTAFGQAGDLRDQFLRDPPAVLRDRLAELGRVRRRSVVGSVDLPALYKEAGQRWVARDAVDIRSFGAVLDGQADDTEAVQRAVNSGAGVIRLPSNGTLRLTRTVRIRRPVALLGGEGGAKIHSESRAGAVLLVEDEAAAPDAFIRGLWFDRLIFSVPAPAVKRHAVVGVNVRDIRFTRCRTTGLGGMRVGHAKERAYQPKKPHPSADLDPAVIAGFLPDAPTDLNEDILFIDNEIDGQAFMVQALRVDFGRRVVAAYNKGRFANISWWGGGAKLSQGGQLQFLRRVRDVAIVGNEMHGANGAFYGNNGQNVLIEDNLAHDITDTAIDFEGCVDCVARRNIAIDAGNFCYSTFYAAQNIRFEGNVGVQTGKGATVIERLSAKLPGKPTGRILFALRSAGFSGPDKVVIACTGNIFAYTGGDGLGKVAPSYSSSVTFDSNKFLNVRCNFSYPQVHTVRLEKNAFFFDRLVSGNEVLVGLGGATGAQESRIVDNVVVIDAAADAGTVAIGAVQSGPGRTVIRNNEVRQRPGDGAAAAIAVTGTPTAAGQPQFVIADNKVPLIIDRSLDNGAQISAAGNTDARGAPVAVSRP
ncbi:hypothetical protein [Xanthobacter sp. KR7-225]|uniref:right-handed parallel beta-helix repeat-containing protein n=1 Tax=Xanthobacter sp. KR7-225 TaxID=3156613 RepID=UPI0032B51633